MHDDGEKGEFLIEREMLEKESYNCRPMQVIDFGTIECIHWKSADQVQEYIEKQNIASMLAFEGSRYVGQLYLQEYNPQFKEHGGWIGERPWADFQIAEPLGLKGRFLTLGCYHVGRLPSGEQVTSLWGRGIGKALLKGIIEWYQSHQEIDGLLSWGLVSGSKELLQWAGQMPYTTYRKYGFREIKRVHDPHFEQNLADIEMTSTKEDITTLRVMLLTRD